jgi:hypothetical protein
MLNTIRFFHILCSSFFTFLWIQEWWVNITTINWHQFHKMALTSVTHGFENMFTEDSYSVLYSQYPYQNIRQLTPRYAEPWFHRHLHWEVKIESGK